MQDKALPELRDAGNAPESAGGDDGPMAAIVHTSDAAVESLPLRRRLFDDDPVATKPWLAVDELTDRCPHCQRGGQPAQDPGLGLQPSPAACGSSAAEETERLSSQPASPSRPPKPLRPALRQRRADGGKDDGGRSRSASVSFAAERDSSTDIIDFKQLGTQLWYEGLAVECDECDELVQWGAEGSLTGAVGRSRFSQPKVLCNRCLANRSYGQIGAWLLLGIAAGPDGAEILGSVENLIDLQVQLGRGGRVSDALVDLLGQEAEKPGARENVLLKARERIPNLLLGGGAPKVHEAEDDYDEIPQLVDCGALPSGSGAHSFIAPDPEEIREPPETSCFSLASRSKRQRLAK